MGAVLVVFGIFENYYCETEFVNFLELVSFCKKKTFPLL